MEELVFYISSPKTQEVLDKLNEITNNIESVLMIIQIILSDTDSRIKEFCCYILKSVCMKNKRYRISSDYVCEVLPNLLGLMQTIDDPRLIVTLSEGLTQFILLSDDTSQAIQMLRELVLEMESAIHSIVFAQFLIDYGFNDFERLIQILVECLNTSSSLIFSKCISLLISMFQRIDNTEVLYEISENVFEKIVQEQDISFIYCFINEYDNAGIILFRQEFCYNIVSLLSSESEPIIYASLKLLTLMVKSYDFTSESYMIILNEIIEKCRILFNPNIESNYILMKINECQDLFNIIFLKLDLERALDQLKYFIIQQFEECSEYSIVVSILLANTSILIHYKIEEDYVVLFNFFEDDFFEFIFKVLEECSEDLKYYICHFLIDITKSGVSRTLKYRDLLRFFISFYGYDESFDEQILTGVFNCVSSLESADDVFYELYDFICEIMMKETNFCCVFMILSKLFEKCDCFHEEEFYNVKQLIIKNIEYLDKDDNYKGISAFILYAIQNGFWEDYQIAFIHSLKCLMSNDIYIKVIGEQILAILNFIT